MIKLVPDIKVVPLFRINPIFSHFLTLGEGLTGHVIRNFGQEC